jgi:hypothetical protein
MLVSCEKEILAAVIEQFWGSSTIVEIGIYEIDEVLIPDQLSFKSRVQFSWQRKSPMHQR